MISRSVVSLERFSRTILVGALLLSGCTSIKNFSVKDLGNSILQRVGFLPPTALYKASAGLVRAAEVLTGEEEYYLGRAIAANILTRYPPSDNEQLNRYVNRVGRVVAASSSKPETFGGYHFLVLDTAELNALAAPGGYIFVSRGMLEAISGEDALAAVLAHEVVHVAAGHGVRAISQKNLSQALLSLGKLAGSLNCGEVLQQATLVFGSAADDVVKTLLVKGYGRDQELEADREALGILARAGYNPLALFELFEVLGARSSESGGWFSTHPAPGDRLTEARRSAAERGVVASETGKIERTERFNREMQRAAPA